jgi:hypothetical protein
MVKKNRLGITTLKTEVTSSNPPPSLVWTLKKKKKKKKVKKSIKNNFYLITHNQVINTNGYKSYI